VKTKSWKSIHPPAYLSRLIEAS